MLLNKEEILASVIANAQAGRRTVAREALAELVDNHLTAGTDPDDLKYYIFAAALAKRLESERAGDINLYLRQLEQPQISLFNLLAQHLPTVSLAGRIANRLLCRFLGDREEVTLLDIGIGTGQQELALLYELARRGALPDRLTIIAVEPSESSLREAERCLTDAATRLRVQFTFVPIVAVAEDMTEAHWATIAAARGPLVVHAAFAAHHVRDRVAGECQRDALFRRLHASGAEAVVLCEPNSDHHTDSFPMRFENCWRHFSLTFQLIERLGLTDDESTAMKLFFAREIEDILGNSEGARCERHESTNAWVSRLQRSGFRPYRAFDLVGDFSHPAVNVSAREGYVGLDYAGETLVSVLCATLGETEAAAADAAARPASRN